MEEVGMKFFLRGKRVLLREGAEDEVATPSQPYY